MAVRHLQTSIVRGRPHCNLASCLRAGYSTPSSSTANTHPPSFANGANDEVARLAATRRRPLTLADLLKWVIQCYPEAMG